MRPHVDYVVDRMEVYVQQCTQLTITNRSNGLTLFFLQGKTSHLEKYVFEYKTPLNRISSVFFTI